MWWRGLAAAWDAAFSSDRPVVLEAYVDPNVPILPPHITFKQAEAYAKALFKGDPEELGVIRQTFRDAMESFVPHKE